ncbi:MAG: sigma-54 dependent transcriptional regulator [Melioribacteraceae bacterium]
MGTNILIVDDAKDIRESLQMFLSEEGFSTDNASNGIEALKKIETNKYDLVLTDLKMPEMGGIELLEKSSLLSPDTFFIVMTAYATVDTAINALRNGAYDYLNKPFEFDIVLIKIKKLFDFKNLSAENKYLRQRISSSGDFHNIIGRSKPMKEIFDVITQVAPTNSNVLIFGGSGTGKELIAKALHYNSKNKDRIFLPINCGAISENLIESELFGHKKGSFTGAINDKDGLFKVADGGTLFLDEIGDLPLNLQVKILRAIEDKEFLPVGGIKTVKTNVRIIAATNQNVLDKIADGTFREDLYYRLNVVEIKLPSLNERKEDIPLLVNHFVEKYCNEMGKPILGVNNEAMKKLVDYTWKGNVRELENIIERAVIFCKDDKISVSNLSENVRNTKSVKEYPEPLKEASLSFEKLHILEIIKKYDNNKEDAANALNIGLSSLYRKMELMGISTRLSSEEE